MTTVEDFLEHYGVKGMKWGVRKDRGHEGERVKTKKLAKLDKKYEKGGQQVHTLIKIHNRAVQLTNDNDVARINNSPKYRGKDFTRDSPLRQEYYREHRQAFLNNIDLAVQDLGTNASGTKRWTMFETPEGGWDLVLQDVAHADGEKFHISISYDDQGYIVRLKLDEPVIEQADPVGDFLEHYGVKGMKWGVRNKSRNTDRTTFKKPPAKLTDAELKRRIKRLEDEKRYNELNRRDVSQGEKIAAEMLTQIGRTTITTVGTAGALLAVNLLLRRRGVDEGTANRLTRRGK